MKILVLDNYDSFTYNLVHIIRELGYGGPMEVHRNDKISLEAAPFQKPLPPRGPALSADAGIMPALIRTYAPSKHILGICLGHQGIGECFGAGLTNLSEVLHGVATPVQRIPEEDPIFAGVPERFQVARYHSWAVDRATLNGKLRILAEDDAGIVMALRHRSYSVYGLQFHPESIITEYGMRMMENWLEL